MKTMEYLETKEAARKAEIEGGVLTMTTTPKSLTKSVAENTSSAGWGFLAADRRRRNVCVDGDNGIFLGVWKSTMKPIAIIHFKKAPTGVLSGLALRETHSK
ncbi:hypothetical protein Y032_0163g3498 [Ancylostoma ceylanicum]|uniref:Uncharacterized protein n=1 Tax=Ancylostoma ceylanicum TaxID=53326 RepID=A0A016SXE7_9BILA|nr:hypothetical protein Y032_0163g3498 [Ancylostoma ceylanicum]